MQQKVLQNDKICLGSGEVPRWPYFSVLGHENVWGICKMCGYPSIVGEEIPLHFALLDRTYIEEINELTKNTIHITGWHGTQWTA